MTGALRYDDVTYRYPDASTPALVDIDVTIEHGAFALAIGPTGAGKSTLLRAANGLVPHFSGGAFTGQHAGGPPASGWWTFRRRRRPAAPPGRR